MLQLLSMRTNGISSTLNMHGLHYKAMYIYIYIYIYIPNYADIVLCPCIIIIVKLIQINLIQTRYVAYFIFFVIVLRGTVLMLSHLPMHVCLSLGLRVRFPSTQEH